MKIVKRDGTEVTCNFDEIRARLDEIRTKHSLKVDVDMLIDLFKGQVSGFDKIATVEIDNMISKISDNRKILGHDYSVLSMHLARTNQLRYLQKTLAMTELVDIFIEVLTRLSCEVAQRATEYRTKIAKLFAKYQYKMTYTSFVAMMSKYSHVLHDAGEPAETPEFIFMRTALALSADLYQCKNIYVMLVKKRIIFGSSILTNAGMKAKYQQYSNCFVMKIDDNINCINQSVCDVGNVSASGGGLGISLSTVREEGAFISGGGKASGIPKLCKLLDSSLQYNSQGGRRPGNCAAYVEMWHPDIYEFIYIKHPQRGIVNHVFPALWISDHFMRCVSHGKPWYLLKTTVASKLTKLFDKCYTESWPEPDDEKYAFTTEYERLCKDPANVIKMIWAIDLFRDVISVIGSSGGPFTLFKDECNRCNMQCNEGVIEGSNLCTEILQYHSSDKTAVCNIASVILPSFIDANVINVAKMKKAVRILVDAMNNCVDFTKYPIESPKEQNSKMRPVSIGVQGLADMYIALGVPYDSDDANGINSIVAEMLQYYALERSCELAHIYGEYPRCVDSNYHKGILHHKLSRAKRDMPVKEKFFNMMPSLDWCRLERNVVMHGVRNSLLIAQMPTVSTSLVTGSSPSTEPLQGIVFKRKDGVTGEHIMINEKFLDMIEGMDKASIITKVLKNGGSIQNIPELAKIAPLFKTVYDIDPLELTKQHIARVPYVCQGSSVNYWIKGTGDQKFKMAMSIIVNSWRWGAKNAMYYCRFEADSNSGGNGYVCNGVTCTSCQ